MQIHRQNRAQAAAERVAEIQAKEKSRMQVTESHLYSQMCSSKFGIYTVCIVSPGTDGDGKGQQERRITVVAPNTQHLNTLSQKHTHKVDVDLLC